MFKFYRVCRYCLSDYQKMSANQFYCDDKCKEAAKRENIVSDNSLTRVQEVREELNDVECYRCGELFRPMSPKQMVCSRDCRKKRVERRRKPMTAYAIFQRDYFKCIYCGRSSVEDGVKLTIDHIFPRNPRYGFLSSDDDVHSEDNLVTACVDCNSSKNNSILNDIDYERIIAEIEKRNFNGKV